MTDSNTVSATANVINNAPIELNRGKIGAYLDGWADLIEGMGSKEAQVKQAMLDGLINRKMKYSIIRRISGYASFSSDATRSYIGTYKKPGFWTIIYIGQQGDDLFTFWKSYYSPLLNLIPFIILFIASIVLSYLLLDELFYKTYLTWAFGTILMFGFTISVLRRAGEILKGKPFYFFTKQHNAFDVEDVAAMNLTVHKTLIRALDSSGIDISKLRLKQDFKGGRRDENV